MQNSIKSTRLILMPAEPGLSSELAAYYIRNRDFLCAFEPEREEGFYTEAAQRAILSEEAAQREAGTSYRFYIVPEGETAIIGSIGLNNVVRGCFLSCFIGYRMDRDHTCRGYMSEAVKTTVDYAFGTLRLHRIEGNVMPRNKASLRVLEKCGFTPEGISKSYLKINGVWEDHIHMVLLNPNV